MTIEELINLLEANDMRLTRPRLAVAQILLMDGVKRHVSAEWVANKLADSNVSVSLASVYNTLNSFVSIGVLSPIQGNGSTVIFDTNTSHHHHFFDEKTGELIDIDVDDFALSKMPTPPDGKEIRQLNLIIKIG